MITLHKIKELAIEVTQQDIKNAAIKLKGIPYCHNGRDYNGVDCWGLVKLFFSELGINLPSDDGAYISDKWYKKDPDRYLNQLVQLGQEVGHFKKLKPLDIPYYRLYKNVVTHTSVMLDEKCFIHVLINKRVQIDTMKKRFWRAKYAGARRIIKK